MKKKIELEVDLPAICDDELLGLLAKIPPEYTPVVKGFLSGILFGIENNADSAK